MKAAYMSAKLPWHMRYYSYFKQGLDARGVQLDYYEQHPPRNLSEYDFVILTGPNSWKALERIRGLNYLMINRKFLGDDPQDVHDWVALSWNGFNGRGYFNAMPGIVGRTKVRYYVAPWVHDPEGPTIIMGQHNPGRCGKYVTMQEWVDYVANTIPGPVRLREWPGNVPLVRDIRGARCAVSLNSTVAVETIQHGLPTVTCDEGSPVYAITQHALGGDITESGLHGRLDALRYLARCQWHYTDIQSGVFWEQYELGPRGKRLCDVQFSNG